MDQKASLGRLIDLYILRQYSKQRNDGEKLTEFIDRYIVSEGLSARQVARMRETEDFPSTKTIAKLSEKVPDINILNPETIHQRIVLDFDSIKIEQDELSRILGEYKITIVAGWSPPQALIDDNVALTLAENISKGISYEFIYSSIYDHSNYLGEKRIENKTDASDYLHETLNNLFLKIQKSRRIRSL